MPQYLVKASCSYVNDDGSVSHHRECGPVVDIPDHVAAELGDAVQPLVSGAAADSFAPVQLPEAKVTVDGVDQGSPKRGKRPAGADPGEAIEGGDG